MSRFCMFDTYGLIICFLLIQVGAQDMPQPKLTFAEAVYVMLSNGCRKLAEFSPGSPEEVKTMSIIQLTNTCIRKYPIDEAFEGLRASAVFNKTRQTKIIIHGYKDYYQAKIPWSLAQAYLKKKSFNVLLVDTEKLMCTNWYPLAVRYSQMIGNELGNLLAKLEEYGMKADEFHLLGISLGAHIAGWSGKTMYQKRAKTIGRITGLDPAGPCFAYAPLNERLDIGDADFVDVIHSNRLEQGVIEPLGHVDFYLNGGGPHQPGCDTSTCSHLRATEVFTESIQYPEAFIGVKCKSWRDFLLNSCGSDFSVLGDQTPSETRGVYYLRTNAKSPFGMGMNGTRNEGTCKKDSSENAIRKLFRLPPN